MLYFFKMYFLTQIVQCDGAFLFVFKDLIHISIKDVLLHIFCVEKMVLDKGEKLNA